MFGSSARGMTQTAVLDSDSPNLKAMFIVIAPSQYYDEVLFQGGAMRQENMQVWFSGVHVGDMAKKLGTDSEEFQRLLALNGQFPGEDGLYWHLPLNTFPIMSTGDTETTMESYTEIFDHYVKDGFYDYFDITKKHEDSRIPAYHVGGWYDIFRDGTVKNFMGLQINGDEGAKGNQKLLMGPWQHREIGNNPAIEGDEVSINDEMKRWFDYWLKGIDNGIMDEKPVKTYTMGSNEWVESDTFPLKGTANKKFYFNEGVSETAESVNDGVLSSKMPKRHSTADEFVYDPKDPTVTIGGRLLFPDINVQGQKGLVGAEDQREAEKSSLTYTTDLLSEDTTVTGKVTATIYASSDVKDTDFVARLTDVSPDGTSTLITDGIIRARFRDGLDKEVFMEKGQVYEFEIDLGYTSHTFKEGNRIRVAIASSDFPHYNRNTNTGNPLGIDSEEDAVVATNNVYRSTIHPSHISLPIVKKKAPVTPRNQSNRDPK